MVKAFERAGERLLARFVPRVTAGAYCTPGWFGCFWCTGSCYRRKYIDFYCHESYDSCCAGC